MTTPAQQRARKISNIRFVAPARTREAQTTSVLANLAAIAGSAIIVGFLALAAGAVIQ